MCELCSKREDQERVQREIEARAGGETRDGVDWVVRGFKRRDEGEVRFVYRVCACGFVL